MIALLDACAIIYQIEAAVPFHARLASLLGTVRASQPDLQLAVSRLSWIECRAKPLRDRQAEVLARYDAFLGAADLMIVEITAEIVDIATAVRAEYGLRTPDAIQAASALACGGGTLFVTNDPVFTRIRGIDVRLI
ncbi:MAG TPA: PIN domain-containing protein [Burkholderiales bacterium]|nr:PIN domain-containing protein [Burkholderiales bacterium]